MNSRQQQDAAHRAVTRAIKNGTLVRPDVCSKCGKNRGAPIEGHHEDYSKPLSVEWLCSVCHGRTRRRGHIVGTLPFGGSVIPQVGDEVSMHGYGTGENPPVRIEKILNAEHAMLTAKVGKSRKWPINELRKVLRSVGYKNDQFLEDLIPWQTETTTTPPPKGQPTT